MRAVSPNLMLTKVTHYTVRQELLGTLIKLQFATTITTHSIFTNRLLIEPINFGSSYMRKCNDVVLQQRAHYLGLKRGGPTFKLSIALKAVQIMATSRAKHLVLVLITV